MSETPRILIVDDEPLNLELLEQELEELGYEIVAARNGQEALDATQTRAPDVILLDVLMPGMDGFEVCRQLKASPMTCDVPVLFMTALSDVNDKLKAFDAGGVDYIVKPFQSEEVIARVSTHLQLHRARRELAEQNERLREEIEAHRQARQTIEYLREEIRYELNFTDIVGQSPALREALKKLEQVADTDATVLIQGETGTGKELFARAIHQRSRRDAKPLVKVNCAALPSDLIESELFGHEQGAFTGATRQRKGRFELADSGTIFLDEVAELSAEAQAKLLRVLQEREFERVGGTTNITVDVRVIAATNKDLTNAVRTGGFRDELYYRLNVFPIVIPPLRQRSGDVSLLAQHFTDIAGGKLNKLFQGIEPSALATLERYSWPGNVRELQNVIERAAILSTGPLLEIGDSLSGENVRQTPGGTLEDVERAYITQVLEESNWVVEGDVGAASRLGLHPSTLRGRLRKLGIKKAK